MRVALGLAAALGLLVLAGGARAQGLAETCAEPRAYEAAAAANGERILTLPFAPFGRPETGWAAYAPLIMAEIGTACPPESNAFAAALGRFQAAHGAPPDGTVSPESFTLLKGVWQERRPFVMARVAKVCPDPAAAMDLVTLDRTETADDRPQQLRADVAAAFRAMRAAALKDLPEEATSPDVLTVFSSYRDPAADQARCDVQGNCDGAGRALCSPHRTGTAVDLYLGHAPGQAADATTPENRLYQSRTPVYRWLVAHAAAFGFRPYAFEPWHWEWTGPPRP